MAGGVLGSCLTKQLGACRGCAWAMSSAVGPGRPQPGLQRTRKQCDQDGTLVSRATGRKGLQTGGPRCLEMPPPQR